jgi:hypothetical protein
MWRRAEPRQHKRASCRALIGIAPRHSEGCPSFKFDQGVASTASIRSRPFAPAKARPLTPAAFHDVLIGCSVMLRDEAPKRRPLSGPNNPGAGPADHADIPRSGRPPRSVIDFLRPLLLYPQSRPQSAHR